MNFLIPRLVDPNINDKLYFDSGQNMELAIRDHQNIQSESHDMQVVSKWTNSLLFMIPGQRENEISQVYRGFFHHSVCAFHTGLLILFLARRNETKKRIKFKHNFKSLLLISTSKKCSKKLVVCKINTKNKEYISIGNVWQSRQWWSYLIEAIMTSVSFQIGWF